MCRYIFFYGVLAPYVSWIYKDIEHILCGRAAQLPNILLLTDYGGLVYQKEANVPYITNKIASDGRPIYECLVDMGGTATNKSVVLPAVVTSKWDTAGVYPPRVDLSGSYIRRTATVTFVIPYTHGHNTYVMSFATLNAHAGTLNTY